MSGSIERLQRYAQLYANTLNKHCICLAGMMASDVGALADQLKPSQAAFFKEHMEWLSRVMSTGKSAGELKFSGSAQSQASAFLAALLMANAMGDEPAFKKLKQTLIAQLK